MWDEYVGRMLRNFVVQSAVLNSASRRRKQGMFCSADFTDNEAAHYHHRHNVVRIAVLHSSHRRRSGWNSGGRMARAEGGLVPSGVGYGEGCPLFSRLGGLGERRELPQRGRKRIFAYFEGHRTLIFVLIWQNLRGTICIIVPPTPNSGDVSPLSPVIYAHDSSIKSIFINISCGIHTVQTNS